MFAWYKGEKMMGKKKGSIYLLTALVFCALICAAMPSVALAGQTGIWYWEELPGNELSVTGCTYDFFTVIDLTVPETIDTGLGPKSVTSIGDEAFNGRTLLMSISLPDSLKSIGYRAFFGCSGLTGITLPNSLESIGNEAFGCAGLTGITIPGSVTSVGPWAFSPCYDLETVEMLDNLTGTTTIGSGAFASCSSLSNVTLPNSLESIGDQMFRYCAALTSLTIPDGVQSIGSVVFEGSGLTGIVIPDSVTSIGASAFQNCPDLESVTLPANAGFTSIPLCAFYGCGALNSITIPSNVTSIGSAAFYVTGFTSIAIPDSVISIEGNAFQDCPNLASVTLPNNSGFTGIPANIFSGCQSLASIEIPSHVTTIDGGAFGNCPSLTNISVNPANTHFSSQDGVLYNTDKSTLVCYPGVSGAFSIPDSVTAISEEAFSECSNLTEVTIPDSVTSIGDGAFCDCVNLSKVIIYSDSAVFGEYVFEGTYLYSDGIYGLDGSTAQTYAQSEGIPFHIIGGPASNYALTITAGTGGSITTGSSGNYAAGSVINIAAAASAKYSFNKWTSSNGGSFANSNSATTTFTMPAGAVTITANFTYNGGSSGGGRGSNPPSTGTTTTTTTSKDGRTNTTTAVAEAQNDSATGTASAEVGEDVMTDLADKARESEEDGKKAVIEIKVEVPAGAGTVQVEIPGDSFNEAARNTGADLKVNTGLGSITFSDRAVDAISAAAGAGDISISIAKVDPSTLTSEMQNRIGDRPVYDFSVKAGGAEISGFGGGSAQVSIPYTPKPGENKNAIVVYYIDSKGKLKTVRGKYDPATGTVNFTTRHFSRYVVGYNEVNFSDVTDVAWYKEAVGFIAARGIATGTDDTHYSPEAKLTRGQFITMVMRAYGMDPDEKPADNFADAGNTYYTGYLGAAKRLGMAGGTGNNMFAPDREITRQEMFALLYNTLKVMGELPQGTAGKELTAFSDADSIEPWAREAMALFVSTGTISGSGGRLNPADTTTRAQMAQVLYNLLAK